VDELIEDQLHSYFINNQIERADFDRNGDQLDQESEQFIQIEKESNQDPAFKIVNESIYVDGERNEGADEAAGEGISAGLSFEEQY